MRHLSCHGTADANAKNVRSPRAAPRLREHLARIYPGYRVISVDPLAPDTGATAGSLEKAAGYGLPVKVTLAGEHGEHLELVWRTATSDEFGHDRRADRTANMVLAFDNFARTPRHIAAIDIGTIGPDGELISMRDGGEPYLITTYAPGTIYADDLRRIAKDRHPVELDLARLDALATYLAELHGAALEAGAPSRYRRAIRDLVGHGEGVFGMIDGFAPTEGAPESRLRAIEQHCVDWRWRLRAHETRLARTHGDFHPFNIVFGAGAEPTLLDGSRGGVGDPADDVVALAINFLLFALDDRPAWDGLGVLWRRWWTGYLAKRPDPDLMAIVPPFFAWRALVVCNPRFYPAMSPVARDRLLGLVERALEDQRFDPMWAEDLFR